MADNTDTKLFDKKVDDLTVGDAVKLNLGVVALCVAVPAAWVGVVTVKEKIQAKLVERKANKEAVEETK